MRLAVYEDIPEIEDVYRQSREHAFRVGHIDWPERFPDGFFEDLILGANLYCFDNDGVIAATARLTHEDNPQVWEDQSHPYLYVGKLASANCVRGQGYITRVALPLIEEEARSRNMLGVRLNCLADNPGLIKFYSEAGFLVVGESTILSTLVGYEITTTKFEKII